MKVGVSLHLNKLPLLEVITTKSSASIDSFFFNSQILSSVLYKFKITNIIIKSLSRFQNI